MSERERLLTALVADVLGPRNGPFEVLPPDQNPRDEYITGVLAPPEASRRDDDPDADIDEVIEEESAEEDQDTDGMVVVPGGFAPALAPQDLPRSIGISFTIEAQVESPQLEVCASWARYHQTTDGWQREPSCFLTGLIPADQNRRWSAAPGVSLFMRARLVSQGLWRVSLYLVNETQISPDHRPDTQHFIFQPQIRMHLHSGTALVPVWRSTGPGWEQASPDPLEAEERSLDLLYRERAAFARGHLCAAVWREIDPERPHATRPSPVAAPFAWTDSTVIPEGERARFSPPDARTELVPCYPVDAPAMDWYRRFGTPPDLDPDSLADTWQPEDLRRSLQPLVDGYRAWIQEQRRTASQLATDDRTTAVAHIEQCERAADRMQQAIDVLAADDDVRLAFCFANKAIAIQSLWSRGRVLTWRPFQLAFILLNIPALADCFHQDRRTCDLLWFPTGGGKTEAYLGLVAFTLALRRRRAWDADSDNRTGGGVGVLSRYTLRLLTIQQFRRALGLITACEMLRVHDLDKPARSVGWRPKGCTSSQTFLWGGMRFSAGLWVGGGVTPNALLSIGPMPAPNGGLMFIPGALDILRGATRDREYAGPDQALRNNLRSRHVEVGGEPAQVLSCPCCSATLAVPDEGLAAGRRQLHFLFRGGTTTMPPLGRLLPRGAAFTLDAADISTSASSGCRTLSLTFTLPESKTLSPRQVDEWWYQTIAPVLGSDVELLCARPARPGYFILSFTNNRSSTASCDFDVYCPNPRCQLNQHAWAEQVPLSRDTQSASMYSSRGTLATERSGALPATQRPDMQWQEVPDWARRERTRWISNHIPIPACTVDDQIYHRSPSLVIATVDKFARLAFEPKASSMFGNVEYYHSRWGYYREGCPPASGGNLPATYQPHPPGFAVGNPLHVGVPPFSPPDLILQDELHLIEGPLGSMVGLYETAVDELCNCRIADRRVGPKYVASTATVRQAESQVQALFNRRLALFPPPAISADDRFFARTAPDGDTHPLDEDGPGRLYVAICTPGKGAQTPIVRIWASLLQNAYELWLASPTDDSDRFCTLVGYFNAIRELAGAQSLFRQDIPQRIDFRAGSSARPLDTSLELSSRKSSLDLPSLLERLTIKAPGAQSGVFATSMFGTGVDVDRLGLMVVHGQPKTTSSYIQATGRVGRQRGGLVVTFFRASRPRDLDHYEFFTGYHRALYRHVEPITVAPFSPRARERGLGPLAVALLRQAAELRGIPVDPDWRVQQRLTGGFFAQAIRMASSRYDSEVRAIPGLLESRATVQPNGRRPPPDNTSREADSELDLWSQLAAQINDPTRFVYNEPAVLRPPERAVVLGDAQHRARGLDQAYENAPQSLREVEDSTGFKI